MYLYILCMFKNMRSVDIWYCDWIYHVVLLFSSEMKKKRKAFALKKDSGDDDAKDEGDTLHADPLSKGERRGSFFHNVEQQVASLRRQSLSPQIRYCSNFYNT